jgi:hypothetical protein
MCRKNSILLRQADAIECGCIGSNGRATVGEGTTVNALAKSEAVLAILRAEAVEISRSRAANRKLSVEKVLDAGLSARGHV